MSVAFLVYHRLTDVAADRRFHDVSPALWLQHLETLERLGATATPDHPVLRLADGRGVVLSFDDATADHLAAARELDRRGWRGVFFIPAGLLDRPGRLGATDVAALASSGHILGCHGWSHRRFDRLSADELTRELQNARARLAELNGGRRVHWLAPPGGLTPPAASAAFARMTAGGCRHIRGVEWGVAPDDWETADVGILPALVMSGRVGPVVLRLLLHGRAGGPLRRLAGVKRTLKGLTGERIWDAVREAIKAKERKQ